jgi:hypothetical protein
VSVSSDNNNNNNNGRLFICADVCKSERQESPGHVSPLLQVKKITINNRKNDEGAVDGWMGGYFY